MGLLKVRSLRCIKPGPGVCRWAACMAPRSGAGWLLDLRGKACMFSSLQDCWQLWISLTLWNQLFCRTIQILITGIATLKSARLALLRLLTWMILRLWYITLNKRKKNPEDTWERERIQAKEIKTLKSNPFFYLHSIFLPITVFALLFGIERGTFFCLDVIKQELGEEGM